MTLSDLFSAVSSLAVLITLVFLIIQTRQSNRNQRSLMQQGRAARTVDALLRPTDPRLSEIVARAFQCDLTLSEGEMLAFYYFASAIFWNYEDSYLQFQNGMLDAASWSSDLSTLRRLMTSPAYRAVWRVAGGAIGKSGYQDLINGLMCEVACAPPRKTGAVLAQYMAEEIASSSQVQA